ncbi:nuclear transport factor 2 family protein [Streptomyces sp. NBC_00249]|uniref:nuclear transport factor 2 family protein n=1 Tax=Streptomyces sp. NBC_00249 TaxID=2975690 RepID=UPI002252CAAB|nr:nuclear transport factor 2 family protein [Streptomyces sp. NBC_00249]MCX5199462.1 nuclear transport factor 2 family protein [Streptomyces sp. NBC_00249]
MTTQQETARVSAEDYAQVQQFYAEHMQLLDAGSVDAWALTFTEDAVFDVPTLPAPMRGREALRESLRRTTEELAAAGVQRRHWHGMVAVFPQGDGTLRVRCYALVFSTPQGQQPALHRVCVCEDVLVREEGRLLVRTRKVTRDDLP